jgi:uncharacterized membrane protein YkvA (DUF1232 family)
VQLSGKWKGVIVRIQQEAAFCRELMRDKRTPRTAKIFLGLAVGYALSPVDLVPDFIPVLGFLDDLIIVPLLIWIGLRFVPATLIRELRDKVAKGPALYP